MCSGSAIERATQLQSTGMLPGTLPQICYLVTTALNSDWLISTGILEFTVAVEAAFWSARWLIQNSQKSLFGRTRYLLTF